MNTIKMQLAHDQHIDQRLQATQDKLVATLEQYFVTQQSFNTIRVNNLCRDANVARQTFYRHYGSIGEIIEVSCVRMINQFLQRVDRTPNSVRISAQLVVDALIDHRMLLQMMFWSNEEEMIIKLIEGDLLRVSGFQDISQIHKPFIAEMMARSIVSFARVMLKNQGIDKTDLIHIYTRMVPAPSIIFQ
ncbi:transcriptional regulator [Paucilactobacillus hokkaidonensis JCM 18461]|uniref:Transcriptional regulator n=2 Tax=Paucilactobacillus hokkaidonensis TaxID=1193095 RepID=A0A0A1GVN6_9LACO|nr:TetR/AcrR family transcriptional regulator [Paucilactobacillus hokkaidonensis]KRO10001.1 hypothetical protein IV59_GL002202 [Paucilactobacillus hokkaidonensis]BAP86317.1 transcriptional regulator [Paucilactobacillus hokkaidonensis JCM 18461]